MVAASTASPRQAQASSIFQGGDGDDFLVGGPGADTLLGQGDNDYIDGRGGIDTVDGGDDNDVIVGTVADMVGETPIGGSGIDTLEVWGTDNADDIIVSVANSKLQIAVSGFAPLEVGDFEKIFVVPSEGADTVDLQGDLSAVPA